MLFMVIFYLMNFDTFIQLHELGKIVPQMLYFVVYGAFCLMGGILLLQLKSKGWIFALTGGVIGIFGFLLQIADINVWIDTTCNPIYPGDISNCIVLYIISLVPPILAIIGGAIAMTSEESAYDYYKI